jgi:hypothetical protein
MAVDVGDTVCRAAAVLLVSWPSGVDNVITKTEPVVIFRRLLAPLRSRRETSSHMAVDVGDTVCRAAAVLLDSRHFGVDRSSTLCAVADLPRNIVAHGG